MIEEIYHRIRFYQGHFSNFDQIEKCAKPKFCVGCEYNHPRCDKTGRVNAPAKT